VKVLNRVVSNFYRTLIVDEMWSVVYRGVAHGSRLSVEVRKTKN
jgi:hypothetical protein